MCSLFSKSLPSLMPFLIFLFFWFLFCLIVNNYFTSLLISFCFCFFSQACRSMVMWVRAMDLYARVFRTVEPKKKR